jgi:hypothetical protein
VCVCVCVHARACVFLYSIFIDVGVTFVCDNEERLWTGFGNSVDQA